MANRQITNGMTYSVVGRYMAGSEVNGYHLVGEDGSQAKVSKEQLIFLIGRGVIVNCRVQMLNGKPLLRGKGVNLNELPIVDEKHGTIKKGEDTLASKNKPANGASPLGRLSIVGRIMHRNTCVGYIVKDTGGVERKLSRANVLELAAKKLIANATVQKYNGQVLLRGVGVDLSLLPSIQADTAVKAN